MLMNIAFKAETHRREFEMLKTWDTHTLERVVCLLPLTTLGWFPPQFSYKLVPSSSLFFPQNSWRVCLPPCWFLISCFRLQVSLALHPPPAWTFFHIPYKRRTLRRCWVCLMSRNRNWPHSKLFVLQCHGVMHWGTVEGALAALASDQWLTEPTGQWLDKQVKWLLAWNQPW